VKDVDLPGAMDNAELMMLESAVLALRSQFQNCFSVCIINTHTHTIIFFLLLLRVSSSLCPSPTLSLNDVDVKYKITHESYKTSTKCKKPNLNVDNLRDDIFQSKIISHYKLKVTRHLISIFLVNNSLLHA
jgi:hypothetical protein